jgi:hypothetical protein
MMAPGRQIAPAAQKPPRPESSVDFIEFIVEFTAPSGENSEKTLGVRSRIG